MSFLDTILKLNADHKVMIFSKSHCRFCNKVKQLFTELNVPYHALELDLMIDADNGQSIQNKLFELTSQRTVPNVFINGKHVGGCDKCIEMHTNGTLMGLLSDKYSEYQYDLIVIGGGSGGLAASKEAARLGKSVVVCDYVVPSPYGTTWGLGGTCVNVGCIPKKLMHKAALLGCDFEDAPFFGWEMPEKVNHNWVKMVEEIQNYVKSLNWGYRKSLKEKSVAYLNARAQFVDSHTIQVTDKKNVSKMLTTKDVLIAVGGRPKYPNIPGAREFGITSDDIFSLKHSPGKTLIVGASYIALECAGFLIGLGLDCTVMVRSIFLRGFDQQIAELIGSNMSKHGVKFQKGFVPTSIEKIKDGEPGLFKVTGQKGDEVIEGEYNTILFAIGRDPCTKSLNMETVGVALNKKNDKIIVNDNEQTSVANIYAIGDVADGKPELTPVAIQAGKLLSQRLYGKNDTLTDYEKVPTTVFTPLEYGCVGLSEEAALDRFGKDNIEVYHTHFQPLEFALSQRDLNQAYGKLLCVKSEDERVVGFHVLGPNAGEITQGYALSIKLGAKKSDFANVIGIHPTCAEVFTTMNVTKASGASVVKSEC